MKEAKKQLLFDTMHSYHEIRCRFEERIPFLI
jgi:hypothetical protein